MNIKNALRSGLESMGFQVPKFVFNLRPTFLGYKKNENEKKKRPFHNVTINRRNGTDRRK